MLNVQIQKQKEKKLLFCNTIKNTFYDLKTRTTRTIFDRQIGHSAISLPHLTQVT